MYVLTTRALLLCGVLVLGSTAGRTADAPTFPLKFDFGGRTVASGFTAVTPSSAYSAETGFGFEPGASVHAEERGGDPLKGDFVTSSKPFLFSIKVPEGNYRVTVTLGDTAGVSSTTVKAEARRLVLENVATQKGEVVNRQFIVNVRNRFLPPPPENAPGGSEVRLNDREKGIATWDNKLTLEFNGSAPKVCAVELEPVDVPTVYLAGDSTVTDQPNEPGASWGQMLPRFFKPTVAIANHAESGETMKSFITAYRLDKILSTMKAGDYLFIQFGHNDSKQQWPQTYVEAGTTYRAYLRVFIAEARRRGATPVLVTSMQRRTFDAAGKIQNSHGDYPQAVRDVAKEENVALIDLDRMSRTFYETLGVKIAPRAFSQGGKDPTHHNNYGAYEFARAVVEGIKAAKLPLAQALTEDVGAFDPARPDPLDTFAVPASPGYSRVKPRGD